MDRNGVGGTVSTKQSGKFMSNLEISSASVSDYMKDLSKLLSTKVSSYISQHMKIDGASKSIFEEAQPRQGKSCSGLLVDRAGPGLIMGRMDLVGWATQKHENFDTPAGITLLKASLLSMINGTMGQRGLLMRKIQAHNVAVRAADMIVDFCVWLPATDMSAADKCYADCVKDSMNRLSLKEIQQYFPSFLFGASVGDGKKVELATGSMVSMPMAAPAAVPEENDTHQSASPQDACEMLFCTTKQKKRKGVPYCGTCRKFMEETVKWYCDTYRVHPAKEKAKFVPAVRNERYGCKHPKVGNCDCKSCHSLRRFDELYPNCESKLDEFKRRTFMFNDQDPAELTKASYARSKANVAQSSARSQPPPAKNNLKSQNPFINLGISSKDKVKPHDIFGDLGHNSSLSLRQQQSQQQHIKQRPVTQQPQYSRKRKPPPVQQIQSGYDVPQPHHKSSKIAQDDILGSLLPNYILPTPSPITARESAYTPRESTGPAFLPNVTSPGFEIDADSLYKAMCLEDPDTFSALESLTQTTPTMNTWLCSLCAVWNHRSREHCSTCGSKRTL